MRTNFSLLRFSAHLFNFGIERTKQIKGENPVAAWVVEGREKERPRGIFCQHSDNFFLNTHRVPTCSPTRNCPETYFRRIQKPR